MYCTVHILTRCDLRKLQVTTASSNFLTMSVYSKMRCPPHTTQGCRRPEVDKQLYGIVVVLYNRHLKEIIQLHHNVSSHSTESPCIFTIAES